MTDAPDTFRPAPGSWVHMAYRHPALDEDKPVFDQWMLGQVAESKRKAVEDGYDLDGIEPEVTEHPQVWVDNFTTNPETGEPMACAVAPEVAQAVGLDPATLKRAWTMVVWRWRFADAG